MTRHTEYARDEPRSRTFVQNGDDSDVSERNFPQETSAWSRQGDSTDLVKLLSYDPRVQNVGTSICHATDETASRLSGIPFGFVQPSGFMVNALKIT